MSDLFNLVVDQFKNKSQYDKFIRESEQKYDIVTYRFSQMSQAMIKKCYNELKQKYNQQQFRQSTRSWHQNQRKLFVWILLALLKSLNDTNKKLEQDHWQQLSSILFRKDILFLKFQFHAIQKRKRKNQWTEEEDQIMKHSEDHISKNNWNQIAKQIFFKTNGKCFKGSKKCRQRWQNHLDNRIKKQQWTPQQDLIILKFVDQQSKKWSKIVQKLSNTRTQHMVKNRFKSLLSKFQNQFKQQNKQIENQKQLVKLLIEEIQHKLNLQKKSSIQYKSEMVDKMDNQLSQVKLYVKKSLHGCFQRGQNGQFDSSPFIFESRSPMNLTPNIANSRSFLTPSSLTPTTEPASGGFNYQSQKFWMTFLKKQSNPPSITQCENKIFEFRSQSNMCFSQQYNQIQGSMPYAASPVCIQQLQAFLCNKDHIVQQKQKKTFSSSHFYTFRQVKQEKVQQQQ